MRKKKKFSKLISEPVPLACVRNAAKKIHSEENKFLYSERFQPSREPCGDSLHDCHGSWKQNKISIRGNFP